jgi:hypothetical protein
MYMYMFHALKIYAIQAPRRYLVYLINWEEPEDKAIVFLS